MQQTNIQNIFYTNVISIFDLHLKIENKINMKQMQVCIKHLAMVMIN